MLSRKLTYKPEEDFEYQFGDLINNIRRVELLDLPFEFERQFFNYLYSTRPREINRHSLLEHAALEIKNATYDMFENLINLLSSFIQLKPPGFDESVSYLKVEERIKPELYISRDMQLFEPEHDFYSSLVSRLESDRDFRERLKKDRILSKKVASVLIELNFTEAQRADIEKYLYH
jgi:hypothetical protein